MTIPVMREPPCYHPMSYTFCVKGLYLHHPSPQRESCTAHPLLYQSGASAGTGNWSTSPLDGIDLDTLSLSYVSLQKIISIMKETKLWLTLISFKERDYDINSITAYKYSHI